MSGRRKRGGGDGHSGGDERWLLTYADMITLLLALFIVLFAMSTLNAHKFDELRHSLSNTFNGQITDNAGAVTDGSSGVLDPNATTTAPKHSPMTIDRSQASAATAQKFNEEQNTLGQLAKATAGADKDAIKVQPDSRGLVVAIAGDTLFAPGSATLKPGAEASLTKIAMQLKAFGRPLEIEGHTDGSPYSGPFVDNMGLSTARALTVYRLFVRVGVRERSVSASGQGDHYPRVQPLPGHEQDSIAKNRRVEIHILAPGGEDGGIRTKAERDAMARDTAASTGAATVSPDADQIAPASPRAVKAPADDVSPAPIDGIIPSIVDQSK